MLTAPNSKSYLGLSLSTSMLYYNRLGIQTTLLSKKFCGHEQGP